MDSHHRFNNKTDEDPKNNISKSQTTIRYGTTFDTKPENRKLGYKPVTNYIRANTIVEARIIARGDHLKWYILDNQLLIERRAE